MPKPLEGQATPALAIPDVNRGSGLTEKTVEVNVWWARVSDDAPERFFPLLSQPERDRMSRFRFDRDRAAYATAHGLLRQLLQRYLPCASVEDFTIGRFGKPALSPPAMAQFNLSHTRDLVAVAICATAPVGVDVEHLSRPVDAQSLAASVLSEKEAADLAQSGWKSQDFLAAWVVKEALAKAAGTGLQADFRKICVSADPPQIRALPPDFGGAGSWSVSRRTVSGHIICAAVQVPVVAWTWQECWP